MARPKRPVIDRLMDKVREDEHGCWIFEGYRDKGGYGRINDGGRMKYVHRVAYEHFNGTIGPGLDIDHMCFVPACVNPEHLRAVTCKQNMEHRRSAQKNSASGVRGGLPDSGPLETLAREGSTQRKTASRRSLRHPRRGRGGGH